MMSNYRLWDAVGLQALRLRKQEQLVGCVTLGKLDDNLLLVPSWDMPNECR